MPGAKQFNSTIPIAIIGTAALLFFMQSNQTDQSGAEAYQEFKASILSADKIEQHMAAHVFGLELYQIEGVRGITVCDQSFSYGCFHGYLSAAIASEGSDVINDLSEYCHRLPLSDHRGCRHGIGHGLLGHYGYDDEGLKASIKGCDPVDGGYKFNGCLSGVFMEYNHGTMLMAEGTAKYERKLSEDLYQPCAGLADEYQPACYYEQVTWWKSHLGNDVVKLANMCQTIKPHEYQKFCLYSLSNNLVVEHGQDSAKIIAECNKFPSDVRDICFIETAGVYHLHDMPKSWAEAICASSSNEKRCLVEARLH